MTLRIGVDTGGTFTDVCVFDDETNTMRIGKVSTSRDDPSEAIVRGVREVLERPGGGAPTDVSYFAHGTTVGTNALLTLGGVRTALITTRGFRDLLELGRGSRPRLYDLQADKPVVLVPRSLRFEVTERIRHDGSVEGDLQEDEVRDVAHRIGALGVRCVAVCFLFSFLRPEHEQRVRQILREELGEAVFVTLSSEVLPEFREFERLSTTTVNAYIGPVVSDYLNALRGRLDSLGLQAVPHVTLSNGGVIPFQAAERFPVRMVLSGPSTGVVGASGIAELAGYPDVITLDMGGTSTDVSLVHEGAPKLASMMELDGRPIRCPMLDIHTVGAGGGSVAWVDSGNHLKVGPMSAGSEPGPACYGRGGGATVTDANVVVGALNPRYLLGGRMPLEAQAAEDAVSELAGRLGLSVTETAQGIIRVVVANMARAIRVISVQRGHDPRDYTLVAFGGAGPLHASWLARELGIGTFLVPPVPGAQSAMGLLMTDIRADFSRTLVRRLGGEATDEIATIFENLAGEATAWLEREAVPPQRRRLHRVIDVRYVGQNYELPVSLDGVDAGSREGWLAEVRDLFSRAHERLYGYASPSEPMEAVTYRVQAVGEVPHATSEEHPSVGGDATRAVVGSRPLRLREVSSGPVAVYERSKLVPGDTIRGPAVIEQMDATTLLLPGDVSTVDGRSNLIVHTGLGRDADAASATDLSTAVDPILVEVIGSALASIVEEMSETLVRAAFSTNIKERRDCTAALFDAEAAMIAQAEQAAPIHLGSLIGAVSAVLERTPAESIADGDAFLSNDPYSGGGSHLPDMVFVSPIFVAGKLTAWAANLAHHADFADRGHAHIFQEGLRIPPVKVVRQGHIDNDVLDLILANCQVPKERTADFRAQIAANRMGVRRYQELAARYGRVGLIDMTTALLNYTERRTRAAITSIPDGEYRFRDRFDCPELDDDLQLSVGVRVAGDEITFDFTDNPDQVRASINVVWRALHATVYYAIKTLMDPDIPSNAGLHRPIKVVAKKGTVLNCVAPAAVNGRTETCQRVVDLIYGALATAIPERVIAATNGANTGVHFAGVNRRDGQYFVYLETFGGGSGARATKDGLDGIQVHVTNTSNLPVESLEGEYPLVIEAYELVEGSGGVGEYRGGMGVKRTVRVEEDNVDFWLDGSRFRSRPWGLFGGGSGACSRVELSAGAKPIDHGHTVLARGDRVSIVTAGGGGYGPPRRRARAAVVRDLDDGVLSGAEARSAYGRLSAPAGASAAIVKATPKGARGQR